MLTLYVLLLPIHLAHHDQQKLISTERALQKAPQVPAIDQYIYIYLNKAILSHCNELTMLGLYSASQVPCKLAVQVPDTTKSFEKTGAPIKSIPDKKGSLLSSNPATIGSANHGPNLISS